MTATAIPTSALQLRSLVQPDGTLQISLEPTPVPTPGPDLGSDHRPMVVGLVAR